MSDARTVHSDASWNELMRSTERWSAGCQDGTPTAYIPGPSEPMWYTHVLLIGTKAEARTLRPAARRR